MTSKCGPKKKEKSSFLCWRKESFDIFYKCAFLARSCIATYNSASPTQVLPREWWPLLAIPQGLDNRHLGDCHTLHKGSSRYVAGRKLGIPNVCMCVKVTSLKITMYESMYKAF